MSNVNAQALANTARECIAMLSSKTMSQVLAHWNTCVEQAHMTGRYDFPTVGYTRKAQIIEDLERCAIQLEAIVETVEYVVKDARVGDILVNPLNGARATITRVAEYGGVIIVHTDAAALIPSQIFDPAETVMIIEQPLTLQQRAKVAARFQAQIDAENKYMLRGVEAMEYAAYEEDAARVTAWEVVENGPDSTDYIVGTFSSENQARMQASACSDRYGYLGYGYTVRPCTDGLTAPQREIMARRAHHVARLCKKFDTPSQRLACELEAYDMQHAITNLRHHFEYLDSVGAPRETETAFNQLGPLFGYADAKRIINAASK